MELSDRESLIYRQQVLHNFFYSAVIANDPDIVERLVVEHNVPVDTLIDGVTAFIKAIGRENYEVARKLLELGADPDAQSARRDTALHYAIFDGNRELIRSLLLRGARDDIPNNAGDTARDYAEALDMQDLLDPYRVPFPTRFEVEDLPVQGEAAPAA